jgi:subtilisin family serine protease
MNLRAYPNATEISLSTAMAYAIRKNAKVINASWGTRVTTQNPNVGGSLQDLIDHANSMGLVVVCAAGNDGEDVAGHVPAKFENVITVGSIHTSPSNEYIRADSSNYGEKVIGAPGVGISSLMANDNSQMLNLSGSSMSAGFVSGLVARMLQKKPAIIPKDLTGINTATTVLSYIKRRPIQQDAKIIGQDMIDVDNTLNNL